MKASTKIYAKTEINGLEKWIQINFPELFLAVNGQHISNVHVVFKDHTLHYNPDKLK
jgi:hypothetical protein